MTTDLWSDSYRRRNYITFTCHFLTENMDLKRITLDTNVIYEKKTGERIKEEIQAVRHRFGLMGKQVCLVTDSGSNIKRAASLISDVKSHFCLGHGIHNLINVDGIERVPEVCNLIIKCKKIVKTLRYRAPELEAEADREQRQLLLSLDAAVGDVPEMDNDMEESDDDQVPNVVFKEQQNTIPSLKTSTSTRWHSVHTMLTSMIHPGNRGAINTLLGKINKGHLKLQDVEWKLMAELVSFFEGLRDAVQILSSDKVSSINVALILKSEIKDLLSTWDDDECLVMGILKRKMMERLDHRFPITNILVAATLLDPRFFKIKDVDHFLESKEMTRVSFLKQIVTEKLKITLPDIQKPSCLPKHVECSGMTQTSSSSALLMNLSNKHCGSGTPHDHPVENECWKYLCGSDPNDVINGDVLKYWHERKNAFPWLHALARSILCIPATSTPSERVFSVAGMVITTKRSRLHPLQMNKIIFVHDNYNICSAKSLVD